MNYKFIRGKIKAVLSLALAVCLMALTLCACSDSSAFEYEMSSDVISSKKDLSLSSTTAGATKSGKIISSGMTSLFLDRKTMSPVVKNHSTLWRALPKSTTPSSDEVPAVFTAELMCKGKRYILNSQTDGVKKTMPVSRKTDNGVCVEYALSLDTENGVFQMTVPVSFYLQDGSFYVSVNCADITLSDSDFVLTKLRVMDYFGSNTGAVDGDYILVPDNCGAIIDTYRAKKSFENLSFKVYGDAENNNTLAGVYGVRRKDSAFVAMIEKGDAVATVNAEVAAHSGYNRVGAEFEITETAVKNVSGKDKILVAGKSYDGEICLCYRFTQGNNANYSGMAIACREHLIRTGVLSSDTVDDTGELPFVLSTAGDTGSISGKSFVMTDYEQLLDMLTYLKGKGFSNIYVRYKGVFTGGMNQVSLQKCERLKSLGTQAQFDELTEYASAQQMKLFFDLSVTSCASSGARSSLLARDISGSLYSFDKTAFNSGVSKTVLTAYDRIDDNVISLFSLAEENEIENISINDASAFLYSDCENSATRNDVRQMIKDESASLTTIGQLMVEKGNLYMIKNADVIASLPTASSVQENSFYKAVPFIPLLLHATVQYSVEPINLSTDFTKAMLRCVEYGALPQFEWYYEDTEETQGTDEAEPDTAEETPAEESTETAESTQEKEEQLKPYSYSDWATAAYTYYDKANRALGNIMDSRMTAHYEVRSGVYCTEYGDTSVYVNYTDSDVTVGGVTVAANDFMRVN